MARRKLTKQEMDYRLQRLHLMGPWYGRAMLTVATTIPVGVTTWLLQAFAGKTTELNITIAVSVSVVANLVMGEALRRKGNAMKDQSAELNRLRGRVEVYEAERGTLGSTKQGTGR